MKKVLIIGAGLAGCYLAARLQNDCEVTIITKGERAESDSMLAQGGIAAALDPGDSPRQHAQDTLAAGQYHNSIAAVEQLVTAGPELLAQLIRQGMQFDHDEQGQLDFGLEGAHSYHRILHADGDQTGAALTSFVQQQLNNVTWLTQTNVLQLVVEHHRCRGVLVRKTGQATTTIINGDAVILATGGLGNLYPYTTNDDTVTGDGFALAMRAKVALADMAYVQFHPTLLMIDHQCYGLITEAIRGAGARLVDENNQRIMATVPHHDLAPRDVVARQLTKWQAAGHQLFLDISDVPNFEQHFIGVTANLDHHHIPFRETNRIPVQPGAHFMMGGLRADLNGQTSLPGLFAIGEVACNGVHGANRLASNSLLDCLVSAAKAGETITQTTPLTATNLTTTDALTSEQSRPMAVNLPSLAELQQQAWANIGIVRQPAKLQAFINWLAQYHLAELVPAQLTDAQLTIVNLGLCAELIAKAALAEPQNLGANYLVKES
ncbi:L-aspartate oxidase [Lapidilactobacillus wuchangensis]|uniref:L-aspartate oxidase n=1 Tax=Lapidilactobacillus wuchangensis TaxID=2486001 RepID=UPI000F7B7D1A|nr:L-aspartate oxidase [Lapidilactobacillus wuchangensis]